MLSINPHPITIKRSATIQLQNRFDGPILFRIKSPNYLSTPTYGIIQTNQQKQIKLTTQNRDAETSILIEVIQFIDEFLEIQDSQNLSFWKEKYPGKLKTESYKIPITQQETSSQGSSAQKEVFQQNSFSRQPLETQKYQQSEIKVNPWRDNQEQQQQQQQQYHSSIQYSQSDQQYQVQQQQYLNDSKQLLDHANTSNRKAYDSQQTFSKINEHDQSSSHNTDQHIPYQQSRLISEQQQQKMLFDEPQLSQIHTNNIEYENQNQLYNQQNSMSNQSLSQIQIPTLNHDQSNSQINPHQSQINYPNFNPSRVNYQNSQISEQQQQQQQQYSSQMKEFQKDFQVLVNNPDQMSQNSSINNIPPPSGQFNIRQQIETTPIEKYSQISINSKVFDNAPFTPDVRSDTLKVKEQQLQKQIDQLRQNKEVLLKELQQLEFKAMFKNKESNGGQPQQILIWHLLLVSVGCLVIGAFLKKIMQIV